MLRAESHRLDGQVWRVWILRLQHGIVHPSRRDDSLSWFPTAYQHGVEPPSPQTLVLVPEESLHLAWKFGNEIPDPTCFSGRHFYGHHFTFSCSPRSPRRT